MRQPSWLLWPTALVSMVSFLQTRTCLAFTTTTPLLGSSRHCPSSLATTTLTSPLAKFPPSFDARRPKMQVAVRRGGDEPKKPDEEVVDGQTFTTTGEWVTFAGLMFIYSAILGPFLDGYHGAFGVLSYRDPLPIYLGSVKIVQTSFWVPPTFGAAGVVMGILYALLDKVFGSSPTSQSPSWPKVFIGISVFSLQYYLSGLLSYDGWDVGSLNAFLLITSILNFLILDRTKAGLLVSILTAISGPVAELFLINVLHLYQYNDADWNGICSWIPWVYFMGGPAVGNLARRTKLDMIARRPPPS